MIEYNRGQRDIINKGVNFIKNSSEQVFQISGNPGTGKSVVLNAIISEAGLDRNRVAPMAYTGAASVVMRMKGLSNSGTIHSWLYEAVEVPLLDEYGNAVIDPYLNMPIRRLKFVPRKFNNDIDLIVIDEAGSVPYYMKELLLSKGIKILVAGDLDQLDPVGDKPAFLYDGYVHMLTEIMRQAERSAIVYLSQRAKNGLPIDVGLYDNVWVTTEDMLTNEIYLSADMILCGRNSTKDNITNKIRREILGINDPFPLYGEKLVCRKNNRTVMDNGIMLANGLVGKVANHPGMSNTNNGLYDLDFIPDIGSGSIVFNDLKCNLKYINSNAENRRAIKESIYEEGELFEFGYAMTTHLAQGSQCFNGIYFEEFLNRNINNKLNYTGLTRFANRGIYVKQARRSKFY